MRWNKKKCYSLDSFFRRDNSIFLCPIGYYVVDRVRIVKHPIISDTSWLPSFLLKKKNLNSCLMSSAGHSFLLQLLEFFIASSIISELAAVNTTTVFGCTTTNVLLQQSIAAINSEYSNKNALKSIKGQK